MLTSAGVSAFDGNYKLKGGFWGEFRDSLSSYYGSESALKTGWVSNILFEPSAGAKILKDIASREKDLEVKFHTTATNFTREDGIWKISLNVNGKKESVEARVLIDATELGDVAARLGIGYQIGMDSRSVTGEDMAQEKENDIIQDLTYVMILKEYDRDMTIKQPENYNPSLFYCSTICEKCKNPKEKQRLWSPEKMITYGKLPNGKYMINWPIEGNDYYTNIIELSPEQREIELAKAKEHSLSFLYYIQTELGFNKLGLADDEYPTADKLPFIPYHRESRRINGVVRFTANHISEPYIHRKSFTGHPLPLVITLLTTTIHVTQAGRNCPTSIFTLCLHTAFLSGNDTSGTRGADCSREIDICEQPCKRYHKASTGGAADRGGGRHACRSCREGLSRCG